MIEGHFLLFLHKNIRCGYSLELPRRGDSNEYPQHILMCTHNIVIWRTIENYPLIIIKPTRQFHCACVTTCLPKLPQISHTYLILLFFLFHS